MDIKKTCSNYIKEPHKVHLFMLIDSLILNGHPCAFLFNKLMTYSIVHNDTYLENWFLQCVKKLIENHNTTFSCPEDYEDIFDNDDASVS